MGYTFFLAYGLQVDSREVPFTIAAIALDILFPVGSLFGPRGPFGNQTFCILPCEVKCIK